MKYLDQFNEQDLIFFDIETARGQKELTKGTPMYDAWMYKARYSNEMTKKSGEEVTPETFFKEKAALYAPFAVIVSIVAGRIVDGDKLSVKVYSGDEKKLLEDFNADLGKMVKSTTAFCGFNNIGFDQPFVAKRMIVNGIEPHGVLDTAHLKPWEVRVVDLSILWKGNSFYQDSMAAVAMALGIPSPKTNMDGSEVSDAFYGGKIAEINKYCVNDVLTTANIFRKFKNKPLVTLK